MVDSSCIFCRIAAREIPAEILRESERVMAFRDIDPKAPTHILLIPKEHIESVAELDDGHAEMLADLMQAATHLAKTEGIAESGLAPRHERRARRRAGACSTCISTCSAAGR